MSVVSARPRARSEAEADASTSPLASRLRRPSFRDRRLVLGLTLVLVSTLLGARLIGTEAAGTSVWVTRSDLVAGLALRASDLELREVELGASAGRYVSAAAAVPDGLVLTRDVGAGELLAAAALGPAAVPAAHRTVTVPVERFHVADDLARGERVDVYVTAAEREGAGGSELLVAAATVVDVDDPDGRFGGGGSARGVTVSVPVAEVPVLIGGLSRGTVDLVRLPRVTEATG